MTKDQIERASELVYEAITGKCWHEFGPDESQGWPNKGDWEHTCKKCNAKIGSSYPSARWNPPLATSLDAWAEHIWPVMTEYQDREWWQYLDEVVSSDIPIWKATPLHHLEAALRMLGHNELAQEVRESCNT
jgi:hypothetical protein